MDAGIKAGLEPMFEMAERNGWWFYAKYGELWFSPAELRSKQAVDQFCWGSSNWELRDPKDRLVELAARVGEAQYKFEAFKARYQRSQDVTN